MRYCFLIFAISFIIGGCKKDAGVLKLKYKSVNNAVIVPNSDLIFTLDFVNNTGSDLDSMFIFKVTPQCFDGNVADSNRVPPIYGASVKEGEIDVAYSYQVGGVYPAIASPQCTINDTCYYRFLLKAKSGAVSDTITSETIVIIK